MNHACRLISPLLLSSASFKWEQLKQRPYLPVILDRRRFIESPYALYIELLIWNKFVLFQISTNELAILHYKIILPVLRDMVSRSVLHVIKTYFPKKAIPRVRLLRRLPRSRSASGCRAFSVPAARSGRRGYPLCRAGSRICCALPKAGRSRRRHTSS